VRSLSWAALRPRLPWLADAILCMALDCAIMAQFVLYGREAGDENGGGAAAALLDNGGSGGNGGG